MKEKITILIADRNRDTREFLQREMTAEGYLVYLAENDYEIIKIIDFVHPDILILDPEMPYMDKLEILEQLQHKNRSISLCFSSPLIKRMKIIRGFKKLLLL